MEGNNLHQQHNILHRDQKSSNQVWIRRKLSPRQRQGRGSALQVASSATAIVKKIAAYLTCANAGKPTSSATNIATKVMVTIPDVEIVNQ